MSIANTIRQRVQREINREEGKVQLQRWGAVPGKPAEQFQPGEFMMWNGGGVSRVERVASGTTHFMVVILLSPDGHNDWNQAVLHPRPFKKTRLVAIATDEHVRMFTKNYLTQEKTMPDYQKFVEARAEKYGLSVEMTERVGRAFWATGDRLSDVIRTGLKAEGKGISLHDYLEYASRHDLSAWLVEITHKED